jgi:TolB-like protein/thioredoxin-like negative regulator of GroEL
VDRPFPAYKGDEPYLFVCYSHEDSGVVYPELQWLREQGVKVWYDEGISAGKNWREAIGDALLGASHVLYYISKRSLESHHCNREINLALDEAKDIIPIYLEKVELTSDLKVGLSRVQALFIDDDYYQHLLHALGEEKTATVATPTLPASHPKKRFKVLIASAGVILMAGLLTWYGFSFFDNETTGLQIRSIAVLPLENLSGDPSQDYVAEGMTVALIDELGRLGSLKVISRLSVLRYKRSDKSLQEIASELGVRALVGGTVFRQQNQIRVAVELIDASTDTRIWSDHFDRDMSGVLALHADVARAIAEQIQLELTPREEMLLTTSKTVNPSAYDAYQKAQYLQNRFEIGDFKTDLMRTVAYYQEAIRLDPDWALAHAGLARTYHFLAPGMDKDGEFFYEKSRTASLQALELDEGLAEAHSALGYVLFQWDQDWEAAEREYRRSFELNPNSDLWGYALFLRYVGQLEEAIVQFKRAEDSSPNSLNIKTQLGLAYMCVNQHGHAVEQFQKIIELNPEYAEAYIGLGYAYMKQSKFEKAVTTMETASRWCRETTCRDAGVRIPLLPAMGAAYAMAGRKAEALEILNDLEASGKPFFSIHLYVALGQKDKALAQLEAVLERTSLPLRCSYYDSLRDEPRFQEMIQRLNLP